MIDLTVKTLDSQNHSFSLEDDITVREFKEQIAESVSVPADSQRLIYCGRVLQDEKKLNEYDVNGKVIHLVQRAPPQVGQRGNGSGQSQGQEQGQGRPHAHRSHYIHYQFPRLDRNAVYLAPLSHPQDGAEAQGLPPLFSNTLSNSRLIIAKRMLHRASQLINRLDDPTAVPSPNANDGNTSAPPQQDQTQTEQEQEPDEVIESDAGGISASAAGGGGFAQAASAAVFAALSAAGLNNYVTVRGNRGGSTTNPPLVHPHIQRNNEEVGESAGTGNANSSSQPEQPAQQSVNYVGNLFGNRGNNEEGGEPAGTGNVNSSSQPDQPEEQQPQEQGPQQQETPVNPNGQQPSQASPQVPRPPQMAELLERLLATQDRLRPYIDRYRLLMLADPSLPPGSGPEGVEENQRVVDGVSESLHYLSHAYHALSDVVVDMGQQPPRNLRCRPIIIQHSALLQTGIPVQVEARVSLHGRIPNNNNNGNGGTPADPQPANASESTTDSNSGDNQRQEPTATDPQQQAPSFGTVFNLPSNVEVLMEVNPESSMETAAGGEQNQSNSNNNNNNNSAGGTSDGSGGLFSWGSAPPPDFIRNLMQAVTGQIVQGGMTTAPLIPNMTLATEGQQTTTAAAPDGTNPNPGQSTQARSNTGTHPTTSTQTRSTPRPHVFQSHPHPLGMGMGMGMGQGRDFDPFLPCNSHHVRHTPNVNASAAAGQQQQTQANQAPTAENQSQTQPTSYSASSASSSADNGNAANAAPSMAAPNAIPFVNLFSQLLGNAAGTPTIEIREGAYASSNGMSRGIGSLMQLLSGGGGLHVIQGILSERSNYPAGGMTLADLLESSPGWGMRQPGSTQNNQPQQGESLLFDLTVTLAQNMTLEGLAGLRAGRWQPLANLRPALREFFHNSFTQSSPSSSSSELQEEAVERLIVELQPHLRQLLSGLARQGTIDVEATVESRLRKHILDILRLLLDDGEDDARFGQGMLASVRDLGAELCAILRHSLRGGQAGLETVAHHLAVNLTVGVHQTLREWTVQNFVSHVRLYSQRIPQPPGAEIRRLLIFKDESNIAETVTQVPAQVLTSQLQPEPEPMETEVAQDIASSETLETEEVVEEQGVFPGHEALPSDWVPIIARDGAKQRRQLEMQGMTGSGVAGFSDAYLGGMPSKRRKLIEQQKPRLLASPTPNHSSISISMERLVREGVSRAGVEEVEGAAASVATDPGVRRAFGQAIRDCLHPRRHMTPDFPDPLRFPNATKYFADPEHASK